MSPPAGSDPATAEGFDPALAGVTGGIGAGKSTLSRLLASEGPWPLLEADAFGHEALQAGSPLLPEIFRRFGSTAMDESGAADRSSLGAIVFDDPQALADLNRITHPWILRRLQEELGRLRTSGYDDIILFDAALLLDWRDRIRPRWIVAVVSPLEQRLRRLSALGMAPEQASRRIRRQRDDAEFRAAATWVVENGGTREDLAERGRELAVRLRTAHGISPETQTGR